MGVDIRLYFGLLGVFKDIEGYRLQMVSFRSYRGQLRPFLLNRPLGNIVAIGIHGKLVRLIEFWIGHLEACSSHLGLFGANRLPLGRLVACCFVGDHLCNLPYNGSWGLIGTTGAIISFNSVLWNYMTS